MAQHENIPPPGFLMVEIPTHGDSEFPEDLTPIQLSTEQYPALARVLNLVRQDNGGPMWSAQNNTQVPDYWEAWLAPMEAAVAQLRDDLPAPEDPEAQKAAEAGKIGLYDSELWTFAGGEHDACMAIAARSPELQAANNFLNDFMENWSYREEMMVDGQFSPHLPAA